jgi:hypothetical protein
LSVAQEALLPRGVLALGMGFSVRQVGIVFCGSA